MSMLAPKSAAASARSHPDPVRRAFSQTALWLALAGGGPLPTVADQRTTPADRVGAALDALGNKAGGSPQASPRVRLTLPNLIEDGAVVPISVSADLPDVREIFILADMNPTPIAAQFRIGPGMAPRISVRVKLAGSGRVYGAVRTGGGLYWTATAADVTVGGCS